MPGVYVALEDFIERAPSRTPPILKYQPLDDSSPLRRFVALPDDSPLILGARRVPAVQCPTSNTSNDVQIYTSVGFSRLSVSSYIDAVRHLKPDIFVGLADIPHGVDSYSSKRQETMTDRTSRWMLQQVQAFDDKDTPEPKRPALFAPVLPLGSEAQRWYFEELTESMLKSIDGLAIFDATISDQLPDVLVSLPRLAYTQPETPQRLLYEISQGVDIFTIPFIGSATDAGIALDFTFPVLVHDCDGSAGARASKSLGLDMWSEEHTTSLTPLSAGCQCYACTDHHRAYVKHLLGAKEMLGWVLLQIHNHHVLDRFFDGVRRSIAAGSFETDKLAFEEVYMPALPAKTGQGPRVRGYQYKSEGPGEVKRNQPVFRALEGPISTTQEVHGNPILDVRDIEGAGLAKKS
ncbi:Queuine tRNA-ribosyltransferase-like protein [Sphaceloma murrayae]|uniref:Queuine tRNA-ribosyltransferase-like protein n=1 Tax=Sphaceloma murrayae TaxID=2082308 RepID=A0A2K1R1D2_9PEZI|nr:Queuine tRNA-ribosyltransferase-like protein [Sphaceloma murrayae]